MKSFSIRIRLTIWYAAVVAITIALLSCGIYLAAIWGVRRVADQELNAGINGIEAFLRHKFDINQVDNLGEELREHAALLPRNRMFRAIDQNGNLIYQPDQMAVIPNVQPSEGTTVRNLKVGSRSYRTMSRYAYAGPYPFVVQVAVDQTEYHELLTGLAWLFVFITPLAGLFAAGTGYWMGGRALRPIQEITRATNSIDANNLERRLTITGTGDELDRLSETINGMLNRIAGSYERIKQFTADASHELRTPTAVVKASAEVLLMEDSQPDAARRTLNHIVSEADYMTRVIEDLLTLARASANDNLPPSELFELSESLRALEPRILSLARRKNIQIKTDFEKDLLLLKGNQNVVERVMMILVDNAVRYTPTGGTVQVEMWRNGLRGGFRVIDDGIGIPAELQSKVFERFYRVDVVRTPGDGGSGLGLSIAKSLTEVYGGSITLASEVGKGTIFTVAFPCAEIVSEPYPHN
ncbi:sensor histidine kinase [Terriglobus albidus]|uniref:sensor histidine kinase n=1 Tax=Terriglobus albidus TaxID=1592106 RepID=UPI0021DF840E|nr:HAMP domain-containing sensor histidine kinase [Terriglobus albidus]